MNLQLVGLSHRTAPLAVRERLHVGEHVLPEALQALRAVPRVRECFILSTCNRVELMADVATRHDGSGLLVDFLCEFHGAAPDGVVPHLYRLEAGQAVGHLFRVASSLDSMVVGEPQIVAQVREAMTAARSAGTLGPVLGPVVDHALRVSKRVRTETEIARNAVSISYAAVELARKIFGDLTERRAILLGAGDMAELAARHLLKHGVETLHVANRTPGRAERLADRVGGVAVEWEDWLDALVDTDIVLASTAAPHKIVAADTVRRIMPRRRFRPIFFIDIAVPRDVEPEVNEIDGVYLYDVDDLQTVVAQNMAIRSHHAETAERLVAEETERFTATLGAVDLKPTIAGLRRSAEAMRKKELRRLEGRIGEIEPRQQELLEAMSQRLVNKLLHGPMVELKRAAREGEGQEIAELIRRIYDLEDVEPS